jgi:conjugal transfer pilus assembly protein TraI
MFRSFFGTQSTKRFPLTPEVDEERAQLNIEPRQLLLRHRQRLTAVRLESGYARDDFDRLIQALVLQAAEYVHLVPASRNENHSETGGLLRFAIETACLAYRRADGKFLSGPISTDIHNRGRDRVWRYATFVAGLCRPLGRAAVNAKVVATETGEVWDPFGEPLWGWMKRTNTSKLNVQWRDKGDARPVEEAGIWIASRIITASGLTYLQSAGDHVVEMILGVLAGQKHGRFGELVDAAYQAAIDQDLSQKGTTQADTVSGVQIHHRILEALRGLVREKWTLNDPNGRVWHMTSGTYLAWKTAATDLQVRLRALGVTGVPSDVDTLAELLTSNGILVPNPHTTRGLKHYYKITPDARGIPKSGLEVVRLADPELIGLDLSGVEPLEVPSSAGSAEVVSVQQDLLSPSGKHPERRPADTTQAGALETEDQDVVPAVERTNVSTAEVGRAHTPAESQLAASDLSALGRYGEAGKTLRSVALKTRNDPAFKVVFKHSEGVALAYPDGIEPFTERPQDFLQDCEAQGLLVSGKGSGRRIQRARPGQDHLPEQFIVLTPRIASFFMTGG